MQRRINKGFTLIELLIAVAIVAILGTLAFPSYVEHVQDGRRSDAQQQMLQTATILERIYSRNGGYPDSGTFTQLPNSDVYTFTYQHLDKPAGAGNFRSRKFRLLAVPIAGSAQSSDRCGALSLNEQGVTGPVMDGCW